MPVRVPNALDSASDIGSGWLAPEEPPNPPGSGDLFAGTCPHWNSGNRRAAHPVVRKGVTIMVKPTKYRNPREAVLVVLSSDGFVEAFAERHVDVHMAIRPKMDSQAGQILAEEYMEWCLPYRYRDLFWPGKLRCSEMIRTVTPESLAQREMELDVLRTLNAIGTELREGVRLWTC